MDYEIRKFKEELIQFINGYQLPIEVKRLVFFEVYKNIESASDNFVIQQREELLKKAEEVKDE